MIRHAVAAAAVAAVLIPAHAEARARGHRDGIIVCDRQGCRPEARQPSKSGRRFAGRGKSPVHSRGTRRAHQRAPQAVFGPGIVRSRKTGATARVSPRFRARFQAYVDALEARGAVVRFMGGFRRGRCAPPRHKHPCGMALDVCQTARDVVDRRCHLPPRAAMIAIAAGLGLAEGGRWCDGDRGHVEAGRSVGACRSRIVSRGTSARRRMLEARDRSGGTP